MFAVTKFLTGLLAAATVISASPINADAAVEARQESWQCADFGTTIYGSRVLAPSDAKSSRCCVYGESIAHCCRNDPALGNDSYWKQAVTCDTKYFQQLSAFTEFYSCNVTPARKCAEACAAVPWVWTTPRDCPKQ